MSGDLRAAVERLRAELYRRPADGGDDADAAAVEAIDRVLALIPEGAVLVTEETLAAAISRITPIEGSGPVGSANIAAAILRHLREGT